MAETISGQHVFISYRSEYPDKSFAHRLAGDLHTAGHEVWIDVEGIEGGKIWDEEIQRGIDECYAYVVVVSPASMKSRWVRKELLYTLNNKPSGTVFPVLYQQTKLPPTLVDIQYIDFQEDYAQALEQLLNILPLPSASKPLGKPGAPRDIGKPGTPRDILAILPPPFEWVAIPAFRYQYILNDDMVMYDFERFMIAKYPVTNAQFQVFVEAPDGYRDAGWWDYSSEAKAWRSEHADPRAPAWSGSADHPRVNVTWFEAVAYCRWLSSQVGYEVRLPAEAEWQRAAQRDDGRTYPWGNQEPSKRFANWNRYIGKTTPVGSYPAGAGPYGVLDMAGNVWEWCATDYETGDNDVGQSAKYRVLRGGSWYDKDVDFLRSAFRSWVNPDNSSLINGFRCARPL